MVGGVAIIEDFTEQRNEAIIYRQAYYDALTDLPNRRLFIERLEALCNGQNNDQRGGLVMFMDMDRFKLINDTLAMPQGMTCWCRSRATWSRVCRRMIWPPV